MMAFIVEDLREVYVVDRERIALAQKRQAAVFRGERPDRWPVMLHGGLTDEQKRIPTPNLQEAFNDVDMMLCQQLRGACSAANSNSDAVPSVRGNYGVGVLLATLGLEQMTFPDKMPWPQEHLSKEQIADLSVDDIELQGTFARALDYMRRHMAIMKGEPAVYCMDTQGPFDLAHLVMGDEIYYAMHDDPELVHHLLEFCLALSIRAHELMKAISGEGQNECYHSNSLYADNLGIRICEDTTALISPDAMQTFALPYTRRLAQHFGGAWVHYCGRNDHLTRFCCEMPEIRAINFGLIPGHLHDHPFEADMQRCAATGTVLFGNWPRFAGESGKDYLQRMYAWAERGVLIPQVGAALDGEEPMSSREAVLDYWYSR
jgi:uroporphyrinogen-III decarboxylase